MTATEPNPQPANKNLRRALARRFPRTRKTYNWAMDRSVRLVWNGVLKTPSTLAWTSETLGTLLRYRRENRLTVAVDIAAFWEPLTGIGWYLYRLLEHLADRDDVRLLLFSPTIVRSPDLEDPTVPAPKGKALKTVHYDISPRKVLFAGTVTRLLRRVEPLLIAAHGCRVLFAPNYFLPRRFSLARGSLVATIHDLGFRAVPWTLREETLKELSDQLDRTLEKSDLLITVSAAVRDELIRDGYPDPDRIQVVHHGPGQLATVSTGSLPAEIPNRFALHVGTLEPRKNIEVLLACWQEVRKQMQDPPLLVLCGKYGWKTDTIRIQVEQAERAGWLRHLGYVTEHQLAALYEAARVVLFPSLYEGFGLPAVEAQFAGTPLVCSDIPVLREVAGDAALFVPPDRPDLMAAAVVRILENEGLAIELSEKGRKRTQKLSWGRAASDTLAVWCRAAAVASVHESDSGKPGPHND